ncbi:hypothetical protein [Fodinicola feengrottensis]
MSGPSLRRLDPERYRRRVQLLAEMAEAQSLRTRVALRRARMDRLREIIAERKRIA